MLNVLFFSACPLGALPIDVDGEARTLQECRRRATWRDHFEITLAPATRAEDLGKRLLEEAPTVVHFSGHGQRVRGEASAERARDMQAWVADEGGLAAGAGEEEDAAIVVLDEAGRAVTVPTKALAERFGILLGASPPSIPTRCVVLNACFTKATARALARHVDFVVGASRALPDEAALAFTEAFYHALGEGHSLRTAFEIGQNEVVARKLGDRELLVSFCRPGATPEKIFLASPTDGTPALDHPKRLSLQRLDRLRATRTALEASGEDVAGVQDEIKALLARLREGPRLAPGDVLAEGRFLLLTRIGEGGFGVVWKALDRDRDQHVAIKVLHGRRADDPRERERFLRSVERVRKLEHPRIVRTFFAREEPYANGVSYCYSVMDYLPGGDFKGLVLGWGAGAAAPDAKARLELIFEIGSALQHAHERGVIHQDVSPQNIVFDREGRAYLTDFDLLRAQESVQSGDRPTGPIPYAAPEAIRHAPNVDGRADVYSLAMVAIFALKGEVLGLEVLTARDAFFDGLACPAGVKAVLWRATAVVASERQADMNEFCSQLQAALVEPPGRRGGAKAGAANVGNDAGPPTRKRSRWRRALPFAFFAAAATTTASARPPSFTIVNAPLQRSDVPEAQAAYDAALRAFQRADWAQAEKLLRRACRLAPTFAAAQLRLAIVLSISDRLFSSAGNMAQARKAYSEAKLRQAELAPRDRALLLAIGPAMNAVRELAPLEVEATAKKLEQLTKAEPFEYDAEFWQLLAIYRLTKDPGGARDAAKRALELDPKYVDACQLQGLALVGESLQGEADAYHHCLRIDGSASDLYGALASVEIRRGHPAEAERYLDKTTDGPDSLRSLANVLYAGGDSMAGVFDALRRRRESLKEHGTADADADERYDGALLAAAYGNFEAAMDHLKAARAGLGGGCQPSKAYARFALLLAQIASEIGEEGVAMGVASEFLEGRKAEEVHPPGAPSESGGQCDDAHERPREEDDPTVYMERLAARDGLPTDELHRRAETWFSSYRPISPLERAHAWSLAYVFGLERKGADDIEAALALNAMPADVPLAHMFYWYDESIGRALWLSGVPHKQKEALPHLKLAFERSDQFERVMSATRTNLLYAHALAQQPDGQAEACKVYHSIVRRWGNAKPRSVTAEAAVEGMYQLRCPAGGAPRP